MIQEQRPYRSVTTMEPAGAPLLIGCRHIDGVIVVDLFGRITRDAGVSEFRNTMAEHVGKESCRVLVNLQHVSRIDTAGLAELVACQRRAMNEQGIVKLINPPPPMAKLLQLTALVEVFDVFFDESRARSSF